MKVATAFAALFTAVSAWGYNSSTNASTTWTTEVVTAYTTYCPMATVLTYGEHTYTVTESTTLTITDCPCTISKPVVITSSVYCQSCQPTLYPNTTTVSTQAPMQPTYATSSTASVPTAGADRLVAFSGAALAGVVGLAALVL